jgi:nucleotide-binding universal stress UspA family protein
MGFQSLLVPVDLTPSSDRVLGRVSLLPLASGARVTLVHVVPGGLPLHDQRKAERDASKALAGEAQHLRKQVKAKLVIEPLVRIGAAADEIAVARLAPRAAYRRPALALALDPLADDAVQLMLRVLPPERRSVDVIHAFGATYQGLVYPSLSQEEAEELKGQLRAEATRKLAELLANALEKAGVVPHDGPFWKTHVRFGSPRAVVTKIIEKADSDLLVLGTHAYSLAAYALLGTVGGDLLRAAHCDVLMVPPTPAEG